MTILSISAGTFVILPPGIAGTLRSGRSCCSQPESEHHINNRVELIISPQNHMLLHLMMIMFHASTT